MYNIVDGQTTNENTTRGSKWMQTSGFLGILMNIMWNVFFLHAHMQMQPTIPPRRIRRERACVCSHYKYLHDVYEVCTMFGGAKTILCFMAAFFGDKNRSATKRKKNEYVIRLTCSDIRK